MTRRKSMHRCGVALAGPHFGHVIVNDHPGKETGIKNGVSKPPRSSTSVMRRRPLFLTTPTGKSQTRATVADPPMPAHAPDGPLTGCGCNPCCTGNGPQPLKSAAADHRILGRTIHDALASGCPNPGIHRDRPHWGCCHKGTVEATHPGCHLGSR